MIDQPPTYRIDNIHELFNTGIVAHRSLKSPELFNGNDVYSKHFKMGFNRRRKLAEISNECQGLVRFSSGLTILVLVIQREYRLDQF